MSTQEQDAFIVEVQLDGSFYLVFLHLNASAGTPCTHDLAEFKELRMFRFLVFEVPWSFEDPQGAQNRV